MSYKELTKDKIRVADKIIDQPIEGLLYDLDLLPEQCKNRTNSYRRIVIERLYELKNKSK